MDESAAPTTSPAEADDIDLTAPPSATAPPPPPPSPEGGPNAPHPNDSETGSEEEPKSPADAAPEPSAAVGGPTEPTRETPPAPSAEPQPRTEPSSPPAPPSEPDSGGATDPAAGGDKSGGGKKSSGAAKRGYTLLEEQQVVPVAALSESQRKSTAGKAVTGYIAREGGPVEGRNADVVLEQVYPDEESVPEGVTGVLPLSERNMHPVELGFEPVQKSRLKLKRR